MAQIGAPVSSCRSLFRFTGGYFLFSIMAFPNKLSLVSESVWRAMEWKLVAFMVGQENFQVCWEMLYAQSRFHKGGTMEYPGFECDDITFYVPFQRWC